MSRKTVKRKNIKCSQVLGSSSKREESDVAKYFKDCSSLVPDSKQNNENDSPKIPAETKETCANKPMYVKRNATSRTVRTNSKIILKNRVESRISLQNTSNIFDRDHKNNITPTPLSVGKSQKSSTSFKSKSDIFNNVTESFMCSKMLSLQELNDVCNEKRLELSSWGLPPLILEKYQARGVHKMFPWQVECLANEKILEKNKNLVYSAPTSAGKTLVAEFLLLKTVLERHKKVIFILPFVSVVREKMFYFQDLLSDSGVRVEGFMGGITPTGGFSAVHVAIATIEKANSIINRLMQDGDLVTLGAVVIDELHLLGDPGRGYLLELLLTKLRYMTLSFEHVDIQLIGMSATLPNLPLIAEWLDAELYKTDFRPIPLMEQCKIGNLLLDSKLNVIRQLDPAPDIVTDTDNIIQLCIETINNGHGVLIFCPTKNWCEKLATQMAATFFQLGRNDTPHGQILRKNIDLTSVQEILAQLKSCPVGLDNVLKKTVSFGVAFHHAGLTMDERDIIEGGFRVGSLKVLIATSTLSSGVNLPARRVIVRSPIFNGKPLDKLSYQQMIGRAGRMGKDTAGESILICKTSERSAAVNLMTSSLEPIESCLEDSGPLIRALLEAIASQIVRSPQELEFYSKCSFAYKCDSEEVKPLVGEAVDFLIANEFLQLKEEKSGSGEREREQQQQQRMIATCLGKACLSASISPRDGLFLFEELQRARKCLVLDTELHVVYLVTPFSSSSQISQPDWMSFLEFWRSMSESERRVGELVGVEERFLMNAMRGVVKTGKTLNIHRRFYTALALHDLVREVPLNVCCRKYNCCRGMLQSLQQSSATFAGMVTNFCKELKWDCMELLFAQFQTRLQFGVCRDLLDLLRLPSLNGLRARSLFKHGIETVAELAGASEIEVEEALNKALPFESEKDFDGGNEAEIAKKMKMRTVFITGMDGLTAREAALVVIKEARVLLKNELGVHDVQWSQNNKDRSSDGSPRSLDKNVTGVRSLSLSNNSTPAPPPPPGSSSFEVRLVSTAAGIDKIDEKAMDVEQVSDNARKPATTSEVNFEGSVNATAPGELTAGKKIASKAASLYKSIKSREGENKITGVEKDANDVVEDNLRGDKKRASEGSERLSSSCGDVVNDSDKIERSASKTLRSRLAEKTKSLMKDGHVTICSMDFEDQMSSVFGEAAKSMKESQKPLEKNEESAKSHLSDRLLNDIAQLVEKQNEHEFQVPLLVANAGAEEVKNQRTSAGSNYSKSPSLFSDSSFLDAQLCSVLEKNLVETSSCLADFEKSNFTLQGQVKNGEVVSKKRTTSKSEGATASKTNESSKENTPQNIQTRPDSSSNFKDSSENSQTKLKLPTNRARLQDDKAPEATELSIPMTWNDDSWDHQTRNLQKDKDKGKSKTVNKTNEKGMSPSLLQASKIRARMKTLSTTQIALSKIQAAIAKTQSPDSPLIGTPKPVLRKRAFDAAEKTPVAASKVANVRKLVMPSATSSNKSDSEDSVINSQVTATAASNKTRSRIERKLINTQKFGKSMRVKESPLQAVCNVAAKLVKQNAEPFSDDSTASNDDISSESCLMFDSDDTVNSQPKISKKIKTSGLSNQPSRVNSCTSGRRSEDEQININSIQLVNVAMSRRTFRLFRSEITGESAPNGTRTDSAVALVTEAHVKDPALAIGSRLVGNEDKKKTKKIEAFVYGERKICGIIFCRGVKALYYMPFNNTQETKISIKERISFLRDVLTNRSISLHCFNAKEIYKMLFVCCEIESYCEFLDPVTADWLMNSNSVYKSYTEMAAQYFPNGIDFASSCENNFGSNTTGCSRAIVKAVLAWYITKAILAVLKERSLVLLSAYREIEMPTIIILANMELRGFGINVTALQELSTAIKNDILRLEETAFRLAGKKFNFHSSKEVAQVLGLNKRGRACTNKNALKSCENPISNLVTLWRKLDTVQNKIIFPLLHLEKKNNRINGNCITHTVTGRVSMHEPNLQTIPRDFKSDISGCVFSVRMAFVPAIGNVMLSADFCQLELRILAHYSKDPVLCKLLHEKGDIFKNIAARLNKVTEDMVDDDMRQRAKQLCYAMIYGMGAKSLAQSLSVSESEAKDYLEAFMGTYKEIRVWLNAVSDLARIEGYVSTLMNRRRVLPGINSKIPAVKAQAERQAVNTTVQGSAADITKRAMVLIEKKLREEFSDLPVTFPTTQSRRGLRSSDADSRPRGAYLILQLHDELLYEVNSNDVEVVAKIVKESMENAFQLRVPLPVKMKVGTAWGNLEEYNI